MRQTVRPALFTTLLTFGLLVAFTASLWAPPTPASAQDAPTGTPTATATHTRTPRPTVAATFTATLTPGPNQYVVQPGDYLARIAVRNGISVASLMTANNLEGDQIYPGQILAIPPRATAANPTRTTTALPPGARTHVVQYGDQLIKIARTYAVPLNQLAQANGLINDRLLVGQVLFVPTALPTRTRQPATITPGPTATKAPPTAVPAGWATHRVQSGDRLQRIAIWYGVTWVDIIAANGLDEYGTLRVGQTLAIPNPPRRPVVYTVKPGDTLEGLSERYQISIDFIRIANYNFKGDTLFAGLTLIIPMRPEMQP